MATARSFRLVDAVLLLLLILFPFMLIVASGEGTSQAPTPLVWLFLLLPLLFLPWLFFRRHPEETQAPAAIARRLAMQTAATDELAALVAPVVQVDRAYAQMGVPVVEGRLRTAADRAFATLEQALGSRQLTPLVEDAGDDHVRVTMLPGRVDAELRRQASVVPNVLLFLITIATTVWAGASQQGVNLLREPAQFGLGLPYAAALLSILGVHELGHYFVARWHGVNVTLPYFIPVPMGLGTFGAFIQIRSLIKSRRAVFDIGIAGPLAGLVIALPVLYFGLRGTLPVEGGSELVGIHVGSSFLLSVMYALAQDAPLGEAAIRLTPVAFAGWIGIFITGLNLMPVGQLDGGHITYGLLGRRWAVRIGIAAFFAMAALGVTVWPGLLSWALIIALIAGFSHLPALNDVTAPDWKRYVLGAFALLLLGLILAPVPGSLRGLMLDCPYL